MSLLFTPGNIGSLEIKNRFVRAPVYEGLAEADGAVGPDMLAFHERLARGGVGLICTGYMFASPLGRAQKRQAGIHCDAMVPGLKKLADTTHDHGAKIAFEISHAGRQTEKHLIGQNPVGPSRIRRDPSYFIKPDEMTDAMVRNAVDDFVAAAGRAVEAGSDLIYLHAGGGDLLNQFLSPFFNVRKDRWGGSDENRFRILEEIITGIKAKVSKNVPILVKMNSRDLTPSQGITLELARTYTAWLNDLGVDGLELTTGIKFYDHMNCWRGAVPVKEIVRALPAWKKPVGWLLMKQLEGTRDLIEGWSLEDIKAVKGCAGDMALVIVGGMRQKAHMETVLAEGHADFIALARPLIRQPALINRLMEGKTEASSCISCNRCIGAVMNQLPAACYRNGLPKRSAATDTPAITSPPD
ncbi:NADH:flavin oxidoreductase [Desulfoluna spongiiphila]|uniref:NADH:flavin oxidoreductase n=1 Tax=Desulfoluna spongiiphila TaxID=419481 RepID=UPI0012540913|nr:NADH:flavin oxidoreductase [Desulfoluna spongiiphila]VVS94286.1 nadh:flavin oxidoreductase/nadh oxidase n-terminal [Desulfoluna spongiiphila]